MTNGPIKYDPEKYVSLYRQQCTNENRVKLSRPNCQNFNHGVVYPTELLTVTIQFLHVDQYAVFICDVTEKAVISQKFG